MSTAWILIISLAAGTIQIPFKTEGFCNIARNAVNSATVKTAGQEYSISSVVQSVRCEKTK